MKKILILITGFSSLIANAQNYLISFAGTGISTTVSTVKVENLNAGTSLTLNGNDILRLTGTTGLNPVKNRESPELKIYPNPMNGNSVLQISPPVSGEAIISVHDMTGKLVLKVPSYLENYLQEFCISGLKSGFYLIDVEGNKYKYSVKLLCISKESGILGIRKISNNQPVDEKKTVTDSKGIQTTVDMAYTSGDRLKFTGSSGIYSTVKMDIPTSSKTITFNFISCLDGDYNSYSVVEISTQIWMAENLKTTKYIDGTTSIPLVTSSTAWLSLTAPGYCWYDNDAATYKETYGALYNWYTLDAASNGGNNLCPIGWHVPSDAEWTTLTTYLGGENIAGGKLKEFGTTHWTAPNAGATDESGFSALPGGERETSEALFFYIKWDGYWWSASQSDANNAWFRWMDNLYYAVFRPSVPSSKTYGFSVRCVKD